MVGVAAGPVEGLADADDFNAEVANGLSALGAGDGAFEGVGVAGDLFDGVAMFQSLLAAGSGRGPGALVWARGSWDRHFQRVQKRRAT